MRTEGKRYSTRIVPQTVRPQLLRISGEEEKRRAPKFSCNKSIKRYFGASRCNNTNYAGMKREIQTVKHVAAGLSPCSQSPRSSLWTLDMPSADVSELSLTGVNVCCCRTGITCPFGPFETPRFFWPWETGTAGQISDRRRG